MEEYLRKNLGVESESSAKQSTRFIDVDRLESFARRSEVTSRRKTRRTWNDFTVRNLCRRFRLTETEDEHERYVRRSGVPSRTWKDSAVRNLSRWFRNLSRWFRRTETEDEHQRYLRRFEYFLTSRTWNDYAMTEDAKIRKIKEDIRIALYVKKAARQFILQSIVHNCDIISLKEYGGVYGIAREISVSLGYGIKTKEVPERKLTYGCNRRREKPYRGFLRFLWDALQDLTLMILMVCAVVSIGIRLGTEGWPDVMQNGISIILSIFLVVMVIAISDYKHSLAVMDLKNGRKHIMVQATRDGYKENVPIYDLVVGDIVHLSTGDQIPADGLFVSGYGLLIDESSLTGEIEHVIKDDNNPFLLSGTKVQDGWGKMMVTSVGMNTEWEQMLKIMSKVAENETPLQVKLNGFVTIIGKIGWSFTVLTFVVLTTCLVQNALHKKISHWSLGDTLTLLNYFAVSVAIIVVAVPDGLPLAVPLNLAFAMTKLMNEGALVSYLSACEIIGSVSCICTDKTGLFATNHMVDKIWINEEINVLNGKGNGNDLRSVIPDKVLSILLQSIFHNTSSKVVIGKEGKHAIFGTPTESALLELGFLLGGDFDSQRRASKIVAVEPFHHIKRKMSVLVSLSSGELRVFCKGASEIILRMCNKIIDKNGEPVFLSEAQIKEATHVIDKFANKSLETVCFAFKDINEIPTGDSIPTEGYTLITVIGIKDTVRPGVKDAIQTCLAAGITIRLVTADNTNKAKAIAKECGILTDDGIAVEGPKFRNLNSQEMEDLLPKLQVLGQSMPLHKLTLVTQLRKSFGVVAVTGEGINDVPAQLESDVGLAMCLDGTEIAKESADIIITDDNFSTIVNVVKRGRAVYMNIQKLAQFQLTVIFVVLMFSFFSACVSGSPPFTVVQLLWIHMIMDTLAAWALGTEPPDSRVMQRAPVGRNANFITRIMWRNIISQSIYQLAVLGVLKMYGKQLLKLGGADADIILDTFVFNTCVFCLVFNKINSRDMENINVFSGIFENWIFVTVLVAIVAFQVIIVEFLGIFTSTVPLSRQLWLFSVSIGASCVVFASAIKFIPVACKQRATNESHDDYLPIATGPDLA